MRSPTMRNFNTMLRRHRLLIILVIVIALYLVLGIGDHINSRSYDKEFDYPLNIDILPFVNRIQQGDTNQVQPINKYPFKYNIKPTTGNGKPFLVIIVKSTNINFDRRNAIRQTWGLADQLPGVSINLAFILGILKDTDEVIESKIEMESEKYNDIVQCDFVDDYFNNTIKTMMGFRWAYETWPDAEYYFFSDDDMYISIYNLKRFINDPQNYSKDKTIDEYYKSDPLYAGFKFESSPHRHSFSKWVVSLSEYPYDKWPPYITAGAYVTSNNAMKLLYLGSWYVQHFRFDDIYLGIVAKKTKIKLRHSEYFSFYKTHYTIEKYKNLIASHGYGDPAELISVWNQMKVLGYA